MNIAKFIFTVVIGLLILSPVVVRAQDQSVIDGIKSYQNGDFPSAIRQLKDSQDPIALRFLGRSYEASGKKREAAKAFTLSLQNGYSAFETSLAKWRDRKLQSSFSTILKDLSEVLSVSVESAKDALRLDTKISSTNEWRTKANVLNNLKELERARIELYRSDEVDNRMKVTALPRPKLADTACHGKTGYVTLQIVFLADGKSMLMIPYSKWLPGCHEQAMIAAAKIQFEPATKNGKSVATISPVEYSFSSQ